MKRTISALGMATLLASIAATPALAQKPKPPASGVVAVMDFDEDWTSQASGLYSQFKVPQLCTTAPHTAGPNEVAIVGMNAAFAPSGASNDYLQLRVATSTDGYTFETLPDSLGTIDGIAGGVASVSIHRKIPLVAGLTYVFGAAFKTVGPVVAAWTTCQGTATIVRPLP